MIVTIDWADLVFLIVGLVLGAIVLVLLGLGAICDAWRKWRAKHERKENTDGTD